ncbi:Zn(2)-C6 fungal-type domain-containing protein [Plasmodiophora brassicae]
MAEGGKRLLTSCALCARVHAKCDGGRPCARCIRLLERECRDQDPVTKPKRAGRASRVSHACSSCVLGKVRCQQERPCERCCRLGKAYDCVREVEVVPETIRCLAKVTPISTVVEFPDQIRMYLVNGHRYCDPTLVRRLTDAGRMRYLHAVRSIVTEDMAQIVAREMAPGVVYPVLSPPVDLRDEPDEFPKSMLKGGVPSLVVSVITESCRKFKVVSTNGAATKLFGYTSADFNQCNKMLSNLPIGTVLPQMWMITHPLYWPVFAYTVAYTILAGRNNMYFPRLGILCKDGSCRITQAHCLVENLPRPRSPAASNSYVSMRLTFVFEDVAHAGGAHL